MELNGLANIKLLMDEISEQLPNKDELLIPVAKVYKQLELMNRYLVAHETWMQKELNEHHSEYHHIAKTKPPFWHDILANPKSFPTLQERANGLKQKESEEVRRDHVPTKGTDSARD